MEPDTRIEHGPVGVTLRPPNPSDVVILYLHGDSDPVDGPTRTAAAAAHLLEPTGATTVVARYGPPFAAALGDVQAAYRHCLDGGTVVVVGEGLGAGLAASLLVHLRDLATEPPRCAVLISGLFDLTLRAKSLMLNAGADPAFDLAALRRRVDRYAGDHARTDPTVSPAFANLHGLCPIQLLVAGTDPLLDDTLAFATRAAHERVPLDLRVWPDAATSRLDRASSAVAGFIQANTRRTRAAGTSSGAPLPVVI